MNIKNNIDNNNLHKNYKCTFKVASFDSDTKYLEKKQCECCFRYFTGVDLIESDNCGKFICTDCSHVMDDEEVGCYTFCCNCIKTYCKYRKYYDN